MPSILAYKFLAIDNHQSYNLLAYLANNSLYLFFKGSVNCLHLWLGLSSEITLGGGPGLGIQSEYTQYKENAWITL